MSDQATAIPNKPAKPKSNVNIFSFLRPYRTEIIILFILSIGANGINLVLPTLIGKILDQYQSSSSTWLGSLYVLVGLAVVALIIGVIQVWAGTYTSEKVAKDLRYQMGHKLAQQNIAFIDQLTPGRILTNLTNDTDTVKTIVSQGAVTAFSAIFLLIGSSIALLIINWRLALLVLAIIPFITLTFFFIFQQVRKLFVASQQNLDLINRIINESVIAASLVRVLNSQSSEKRKFQEVNKTSLSIGLKILNLFAGLFPIINLFSNIAILSILWYGGRQVIVGDLSLGGFTAFFSYLSMLITPIFLLSFISTSLSRAFVSLGRINEILDAPLDAHLGTLAQEIKGQVEFKNVSLELDKREVLKDISFSIKPRTRTAILGPTASGKTQVFSLLAGLLKPTSGKILLDGHELEEYDRESMYSQLGLVFQDSVIFNTTLRENIQFREEVSSEVLDRAIKTAALDDLIDSLPEGLDTQISERGGNLSGGQKQRVMLARALVLNPTILLLDDFTARVDINTEERIQKMLAENYPNTTLISITQKIQPVEKFDQIIVFMEGELLAAGTHQALLETSFEYKQIWQSQQSTEE